MDKWTDVRTDRQNCYINNARPDETSILELSAEGYPIRKI